MKSTHVYTKPQMDIVHLDETDVIVTSGGMQGGDGDILGDGGPWVPLD